MVLNGLPHALFFRLDVPRHGVRVRRGCVVEHPEQIRPLLQDLLGDLSLLAEIFLLNHCRPVIVDAVVCDRAVDRSWDRSLQVAVI